MKLKEIIDYEKITVAIISLVFVFGAVMLGAMVVNAMNLTP